MNIQGLKDFHKKTLSPFWKLWQDESFLDMTGELFATVSKELIDYTQELVSGVSVDTASRDSHGSWVPLRLGMEEGRPLDYTVGPDLEINRFFVGGSPDPGKLFWRIPHDLLFDKVSPVPNEGMITDSFERVGDMLHVSDIFLSKCVMEPAVIDDKITTVRIVWAYNAKRAFQGQLIKRHSRFAGEVMDAREDVEDAVRSARTAWTQGLIDSAFSDLMDSACVSWTILSGEPEVEDLPYVYLTKGMLGPEFKGSLSFPNNWEPKEVLGGSYVFTIEGHKDDVALYRSIMSESGKALEAGWPYNEMNPAWWVLRDTGLIVISLQGVKWPELVRTAVDTLPLGRPVIFQVEGEGGEGSLEFWEGNSEPIAFASNEGSIELPELVRNTGRKTLFI